MTEPNEPRLILLSDFVEQRLRKEQEITFYEAELRKIENRLFFLRKEKELTETIIRMLEKEKIIDIKDEMEKRLLENKGDD